jgi:hypothetical protein
MSEFRILDDNYAFDPSVIITATSEDPNFPASNLRRYHRSRVWRSATVDSPQRVVFDLRSIEEIDSFALLFNPIRGEGVKFSDSAVIRLLASATNVWSSPAVDVTLTLDQDYEVITHFFTTAQSYRYWAVEVSDPGNAYGYIEIPKIILSKSTQLSQAPEIGFSDTLEDQSKTDETAYGHRYADLYPTRRSMEFSYSAMTSDDIETLQRIYARVGKVTPIAVALDPTETLFDKDRFFLYGYLNSSFKAGHRFYSFFDSGLSIEEAL